METVRKVALVVEYDGSNYNGFQYQINAPTIQDVLEESIRRLTGETVRILGSSRTDTGVHARGQVISFRTGSVLETGTFIKGLNYYLPEDIAVRAAYDVDESFDVRRAALSREYRYYIANRAMRAPLRRGWTFQVRPELDEVEMDRACRELLGVHDFCSFVTGMDSDIRSTTREIFEAGVKREGDLVTFRVVANAFLRHQVRNTVGLLVKIGTGKAGVEDVGQILEAREPGLAGPTAPPQGLFLERVSYPEPYQEIGDENIQRETTRH